MSPSPACPPRSSRIHRSGIRTTPKATNGRSSSKQPLFVWEGFVQTTEEITQLMISWNTESSAVSSSSNK
jgi:hypothetical protein